jgi:hypothetical protein
MRYEGLFRKVVWFAVFAALGFSTVNSYAESPKAILHDTGAKLKEATHDVESMVHHGSKKTKHQVKTGTVSKEIKHLGKQSKKNLNKALGK